MQSEARQRERGVNGQAGAGNNNQGRRMGIPLSNLRRVSDPRRSKEGQKGAAAAAAAGGRAPPAAISMAPLSPPPYSGAETRRKHWEGGPSGPSGAPGASAPGGAGGAAGGGGRAGGGGIGAATSRGEDASPKLTADALQHLQPVNPSPALAAFEAREPEPMPSAKQGGAYWGKVKVNVPACFFFFFGVFFLEFFFFAFFFCYVCVCVRARARYRREAA